MRQGRQIVLASRPVGLPVAADFSLATVEVSDPGDGEVLVRNTAMSVDPYMRGRMSDAKSYAAPYELGGPLDGGAVGVVEASRDPQLPVGTSVLHAQGWRDYAVGAAASFRPIDTASVAPSAYLGVLGMPGLTAYVGLFVIDDVKAGETVFISSAAGAVGTIAAQLAKRRGARVIGSTRSADSAALLRDRLHVDEVIVVAAGRIADQLGAAARAGIEMYFDNVGGEQLEAAIAVLNTFGRISVCGMIGSYNEPEPGPRNMTEIVKKRLRIQGFLVSDHQSRNAEFLAEVRPAVAAGEIDAMETFVDGLERAPEALISLFAPGAHIGKLIVRLDT